VDPWAYHHQVRVDFSRPGKPTIAARPPGFKTRRGPNPKWSESLPDSKALIGGPMLLGICNRGK